MKLPILFLGALMCIGTAFADDASIKLAERKSCTQLKAEIDKLLQIESSSFLKSNNLTNQSYVTK